MDKMHGADATPQSLPSSPSSIDLDAGRRAFIGALGLGTAGMALMGGSLTQSAMAAPLTDVDIFNFALNFEYLGAEFYLYATTGSGLPDSLVGGTGQRGPVKGGRKANLDGFTAAYARQLANDELGHVKAVRSALGRAAVARPAIDPAPAFTAAAKAAGIPGTFDPFADNTSFLLAAFVLEDVCVTALIGAAPLLKSKANLDAAAGLLGVESYQAGMIRVKLYEIASSGGADVFRDTSLISNLRAQLDGTAGTGHRDDQPIRVNGMANVVPTDDDSLAFARNTRQVLNIAYGAKGASKGLFFPRGVNGTIQ